MRKYSGNTFFYCFLIIALSACKAQETISQQELENLQKVILSRSILVVQNDSTYLKNWQQLDTLIGQATIIGLGESTHGTDESCRLNCALIKTLVEKKHCTRICLEDNPGRILQLNDYITGKTVGYDNFLALTAINSRHLQDLIEWVRTYNLENGKNVQFYGLNFYETSDLCQRVLENIQTLDTAYYPTAVKYYQELRNYLVPAGNVEHFQRSPDSMSILQKNALDVVSHLSLLAAKNRTQDNGFKIDETLHYAEVILQSLSMPDLRTYTPNNWIIRTAKQAGFNTAGYDYRVFDEYRDSCMFVNAQWAIEKNRDSNETTVIWAHNLHVGKRIEQSAIFRDSDRYKRLGLYLHDNYGKKYFVIGHGFYSGKFNAGYAKNIQADVPPQNALENLISYMNLQCFLISTQDLANAAPEWFHEKRTFRVVGTRQNTGREFTSTSMIPEEFDAFLFYQKSTPTKPAQIRIRR